MNARKPDGFAGLASILSIPALIAGAACLAGCPGDDPAPLFVDTQWQVRCDIQGGCFLPPLRNVFGVDEQDNIDLFCAAQRSGENVILTMRANRKNNDFGIELRNVVIPSAGGPIGGASCEVVIKEDVNTYRGSCGPAVVTGGCLEDPEVSSNSCDQPCRISNVLISDGDPRRITGNIYCQGLPLTADPKRVIELTNGDSGASGLTAQNSPASFLIEACEGL